MKSLRFLDRRLGYSLGAVFMLLGMTVPAVFPAFASADAQVTSRSMTLSSSAAAATGVSYKLTFTPTTTEATGYVVVFFCNDSPIIGQTCTTPTGFNAASATSSPSGVTGATGSLEISQALTAATPVTITFSGIHNPTNATDATTGNGFYARVQTYVNQTAADAAVSGGATDTTGLVDDGGIAMAITSSIGVTAAVRETMTFCVSGSTGGTTSPGPACATNVTTPSITLGHGTPAALDATAVDTALDYAQISTNAASGAVIRMTNNNSCGGLKRSSAAGCDIAPVGAGSAAAAIAAGQALFGMQLGTPVAATGSTVATGTVTRNALYSTSSDYGMGTSANADPTLDTTSTYGGKIFDTTGAPIADMNVPITFAAGASATTPAGIYQATMNLIATGTF